MWVLLLDKHILITLAATLLLTPEATRRGLWGDLMHFFV